MERIICSISSNQLCPQIESHYNHEEYEYVSLFSGGLDSLIGFIDFASLAREGKKVLLVSHYDMGKERQDQKTYT